MIKIFKECKYGRKDFLVAKLREKGPSICLQDNLNANVERSWYTLLHFIHVLSDNALQILQSIFGRFATAARYLWLFRLLCVAFGSILLAPVPSRTL